jgi:predicted short-subunit dehydrogenase-like oxidoreductase (DUF2520 family)
MPRDRIGIIGTGRVGGALARALVAAGIPVGPVWSRGDSAAALAAALAGVRVADSPSAVVAAADLVVIAVPDRVIGPLVETTTWRTGVAVVHTSGATPVAALAAAGALTGGWHPLKSFAGDESDADLAGVTFAIEAPPALVGRLSELTAALGGVPFTLRPGDRVRYHAAAVLASNALIALLAVAADLWRDLGVDRATALRALLPLVRGTVENAATLGIPAALTGPVERGDVSTVAAHLAALEDDHPRVQALYRLLGRQALDLAHDKGGLTEAQQTALAALLDGRSIDVVRT